MTTELRVTIGIPYMLGREDDFENLIEGAGGLFPDLATEIRNAIQSFVSEEVEVGWKDVEVKVKRV